DRIDRVLLNFGLLLGRGRTKPVQDRRITTMAKRPQPKLKAQTSTTSGLPPRLVMNADQQRSTPVTTHVPSTRTRPTYVEAVALYEKGLDALQRHDYNHALERLQSVLRLYPEEKELHERVRLYL